MDSNDLASYVLGLGRHAYRDRDLDRYVRLHEVARTLAGRDDGEAESLRLAARLSVVDRTLAALLVAATGECEAALGAWPRLSDEAYFAVARAQGRLIDFIAFWDWFVIPESSGMADPAKRHRLLAAHLLGLSEGHEREGVRLAVLSMFEGSEEQAAVALAICNDLDGADALLHTYATERLLLAAECGEIGRYRNEFVDLSAQVVATLGRWGVGAARPYLEALLRNPPETLSPLTRQHLRRAVQQLGAARL